MTATFEWSPEQKAIFDFFAKKKGDEQNLVVRARAGTGKTTTILEAINYAPESSILIAAFNKKIAVELSSKLTHPTAEAATLHSLGNSILRKFWKVQVGRYNGALRSRKLFERIMGDQTPDAIVKNACKLFDLARQIHPLIAQDGVADADERADLFNLAARFDCMPAQEWEDLGFDVDVVISAVARAMHEGAKREAVTEHGIDFTDMLWLPLRHGWVTPRFELVVIDEAQDMNPAQLLLASLLCSGRVVLVGDDRQAIYGFRGADSKALDRALVEIDAQELGLRTTYRCAKTIVAEAAKLVPDYTAAPNNPDGTVSNLDESKLPESVRVGDAVLSRLNAPLIGYCLQALKSGTPARIEGRDIAAELRRLIKELAVGRAKNSIPALLARIEAWEGREVVRVTKGITDAEIAEIKASLIRDKADCLRQLLDGATSVGTALSRLDDLFEKIKGGNCVVFSTVHKAKGLEWSKVFVLESTFRRGKAQASDGETKAAPITGEEANIRYVAVTRAKDHLVRVEG